MRQTSLIAYNQLDETKLNKRQQLVLEALEEISPATNKMVAEHLNWPINTVTPRCLELRNKRKVVEAYVRKDMTGRMATFWKPRILLTEYGDIA